NGDLETAEQLWWRVIAVSPVDAQAHEAIKRIAAKQSAPATSAGPAASAAPAASRTEPAPYGPPIPLTRRPTLGTGAIAPTATGATGAVVAVLSIRRWVAQPSLRRVSFDVVTVDEHGKRNPPEKYGASMFTQPLGASGGIDMVAIPGGTFTMGSPMDEPERRP